MPIASQNGDAYSISQTCLTVYLCLFLVFLLASNASAEPVIQFTVIVRVKDQYGKHLKREEIISWKVTNGNEVYNIDITRFREDEGRGVLNLDSAHLPSNPRCVSIAPILPEEQFSPAAPLWICRGDDKDNVFSVSRRTTNWLSTRASYVHSFDQIVSNGFGATLEWNRLVSEIAPQRSSRWWWESILAVNTHFGTAHEQQATLPGIEPYETIDRPSFFGTVEGGFGIALHLSARVYLDWLTTVHFYYEWQEAVKSQDGEFSGKSMVGGGIGTYLNMRIRAWNFLYVLIGVGYRYTGVSTLARSEFNFFGPKTNSSEGGNFGKLQLSIGPAFRF